jgi:glycosyltransferase involved in cell wall biosynthesis
VTPSIAQSYGGPTQSLAGYSVASRHAAIEVSIAAPRCGAADLNAFVNHAGDAELYLFPASGGGAFSVSPALVRWVRQSAPDYDVVHVHGLFNPISSLAARTALRRNAAVIIRPFGTLSRYTFHHRRTGLKKAYFRLIERRNLLDAAALHFTSVTERNEADWHGIDFTGRAYVVPPPSPGRTSPRPAPDQSETGDRVVFVGRINPIKNLECLIDAWKLVQQRIPGASLAIAGNGEPGYVATLQRRASLNGVANSVVFDGFVSGPKKDKLLESANLLVLPSHHENFGVVILEALEAGLPVVVSQDVHLADFVRDNDLGKVATSTPAGLADAIVEVLGDDRLRQRARSNGPDIVAGSFSPAAIGDLLSKMYHAAIERRAPR